MVCPKCKKNLNEDVSFIKSLFHYFRRYTYFCVECDYSKVQEIKISKEDYLSSLTNRTLIIQNTMRTDKTYRHDFNKNAPQK